MKVTQTCFRAVRPGDKKFIMQDGLMTISRAGFEVNPECPAEYKQVILTCIHYGWLKPIAYVKDNELFWEEIGQ